jgi:type IV pilus assembly protein PilC
MAAGAATAAPARSWAYQGRDGAGKRVKGRVEAATESAAIDRMRTMGLSPIKLTEVVAGTGLNREIEIGGGSRVGLKDLAVLSRQAATMVSAGLSLLKALSILAEQTENKSSRPRWGASRAMSRSGGPSPTHSASIRGSSPRSW